MMLNRWRDTLALWSILGGLCLSVQSNTTAAAVAEPPSAAEPSAINLSTTERMVRIALLLPLQSDTLREAAEAVRAGFQAGYEREKDGISISIVGTGDSAQEALTGYRNASAQNDIVVGPLARTAVTAVVQGGAVDRPTITLTPPDSANTPPQMLVMGLSIEDEARQVADWASVEHASTKAIVLFTRSAWQRRAAKAFDMQWQQHGREAELLELSVNDSFLNVHALTQLKKQLQANGPVVFLALDARQARQVRAVVGNEAILYGTSQLNPLSLPDRYTAEHSNDMDGMRLLDIPWQLQADHPAVMVYPRLVAKGDQKLNADLDRLYALGIDAYRVAREIALQHTSFELDGVTGRLSVRFDGGGTHFERAVQQAVYRDGNVVPVDDAR